MKVEEFFELFEQELKQNKALTDYHRLVNSPSMYQFRKSYMKQRLEYVERHVKKPGSIVWDVGCGFGTSTIFLAINGFKVHGSTLEFYFEQLDTRLDYWKQYGDVSGIDFRYENIFDMAIPQGHFDYVLAQDTLHHLEPFREAALILKRALKPDGMLVVSEENGNNIVNNLKNFKRRGFKRVVRMYDDKLKKEILIGNENTRSLARWKEELNKAGLSIHDESVEYIRYFFPHKYTGTNTAQLVAKERSMSLKPSLRREYFFFGLNFTAAVRA